MHKNTKMKFLHNSKFASLKRVRCANGFSIVEALVSLVVAALISGIILDFFSQLMRSQSKTQNEIYANAVIDELLENSKTLGYFYLKQHEGDSIDLPLDSLNQQNLGFAHHPDALILDCTNLHWNPKSLKSKFRGGATYSILPSATAPNAVNVTVTAFWADSSSPFRRTITGSRIFTKDGLSKWSQ